MEILILVIIVIIAILWNFRDKGKIGENKVSEALYANLNNEALCANRDKEYRFLNDVIIPDNVGGTTQIDHIVLSPYGIFVIETKNLQGWIFGNADSKMWMQQIFNEKHQFYNPIRQNYKHIACLAKLTKLPEKYFFPVIVFVGDSSIKTINELPDYVTAGRKEMLRYIKSNTQKILDDNTLAAAYNMIESQRLENSKENTRKHVQYVRDMASGQRSREIPLCPRCGREMVKRQAKIGPNAGQSFWGCPNYPACRGIVNER